MITSLLGRLKEESIERGRIKEIVKTYTPPKSAGLEGSYATLMIYDTPLGQRRTLAFEGWREAEQAWLSTLLCTWAKVPCRSENTATGQEGEI